MRHAQKNITGVFNPILLDINSENEFAHWYLPARIYMLRIGLCFLSAVFVVMAVMDAGPLIVKYAYGVCIAFCMLMYFSVRGLIVQYGFDMIVSLVVGSMVTILFLVFYYVNAPFIAYVVTGCLILIWLGALSGLSYATLSIVSSLITLALGCLFSYLSAEEYFLLALVLFSGGMSLFFSYFKEQQLRQSFILNGRENQRHRTKNNARDVLSVKQNVQPASAWSRTLKDLSIRLLSVEKTDQMFVQLLEQIAKAINCDACAACLNKDDVLTVMALQGSLVKSSCLAPKDIWSYGLISVLKTTKNVNLGLASFGLLESSVRENELASDYRLDIPVFSKNKLSAIITLLRKDSDFLESEVQLASSMVFHAMIALRLAKFQSAARSSKGEGVEKKDHWLTSKNERLILHERRDFIKLAQQEFSNLKREKQVLSLLLIEVDHFENIEQTLGGEVAQSIFLAIVEMADGYNREHGLMGYYDNGVFAMQISIDLRGAETLAESLRCKISQRLFRVGSHKIEVTVSIGVTTLTEVSSDYMSVLRCADMGLFLAKDQKGNAVRVSI